VGACYENVRSAEQWSLLPLTGTYQGQGSEAFAAMLLALLKNMDTQREYTSARLSSGQPMKWRNCSP
jgi:hypothetical protein